MPDALGEAAPASAGGASRARDETGQGVVSNLPQVYTKPLSCGKATAKSLHASRRRRTAYFAGIPLGPESQISYTGMRGGSVHGRNAGGVRWRSALSTRRSWVPQAGGVGSRCLAQ